MKLTNDEKQRILHALNMHTNVNTIVSVHSHTYPQVYTVMLWLQPHRRESSGWITGNISLQPTNQGLSRSRSYQPTSPLIRPAGRWSQPQVKLNLSLSVVFTAPFLPFSIGKIHYKWLLSFLNTFVTFHCSFWLWWILFLKIRDLNSCHDSCKNNVMQNCQDFQRC